MKQDQSEETKQFLTFTMGNEHYAIAVTDIREVLLIPKVTRIPRMPDFMKGVINLRGSVVPILDLKMKFGMGETKTAIDTAIIVVEIPYGDVESEQQILHVGIFADCVKKVIAIASEDIEPPPKIGSKINTAFIEGMGHVDNEFIVILNIKEILTVEDLELLENVEQEEIQQ
jgi:purine-binding chemotaxis protein CheW